jgi:flagellar hook-basal body complex protein FliE
MEIRTVLAAQNYAKARSAAAPEPQPGSVEAGFANLAQNFADVLSKGEDVAKAAMTGRADPHALVEALASSKTAVETVATVRDKVVEAYQEILRMPV